MRAQIRTEAWYNHEQPCGSTHKNVSLSRAGSEERGVVQMRDHYGCPVQASINVLSGKWKVQILWHLSFGPRRFAHIRKKLPRISEKVLTDQLRQLESDGVIAREVTPSLPPQVTYWLNHEGEKLVPLMESLCTWGSAHFGIKPNLPRPARQ